MTRVQYRTGRSVGFLLPGLLLAAAGSARADDAPPAGFWDTFTIGGQGEAGITANAAQPSSGVNFGHLFTDRANQLVLNQVLLTAARPVDPKATDFDWGFRLQGMVGTDARYTHFLGELDTSISERTQLDIVEASISAHLPVLTENGVDVKLGQYPTPLGFEVIDPSGNPFYSHSYIFNFGIPLKHTGGYATVHVNDTLDIWAGVDSGVNTSLGDGDNNSAASFIAGIGLNGLADGKLTVLALTHIGPENANVPGLSFNPNSAMRELTDAVFTYKANDALTLVGEINYAHDDGFHASAWGLAGYASYTVSDPVTVNIRTEIYQDCAGFFVAGFPHPLDFVHAEYGLPSGIFNSGPATYGEVTLGVTLKPDVPDAFKGLMIRPELRVDSTLDGGSPFNDGKDSKAVTAAVDLVVPFTL